MPANPTDPNMMMSTEGPVGMGNPLMNMMQKLMAKRRDINLPPESGQVDPRLAGVIPLDQLKKAFNAGQTIATDDDPLRGLMRAGGYK